MKYIKRAMIIFVGVILLVAVAGFFYMRMPLFGEAPAGKRLERLQQSPHYREGKFQNLEFTPDLTEGYSMTKIMYDFIFTTFPRTKPAVAIPTVKTDLKNLSPTEDVLIWFGHSSYFIQLGGLRFLVDPVFSGNASPVPNSNKSFVGTDVYSAADMPEIDFLLITHDHYDHLDYPTIMQLKQQVKQVVCGLGVGSHFERWGFDMQHVVEKDWNESLQLRDDIMLYTAPTRHFSGRSFKRNNTLWLSFILEAPDMRLYLGGDSGYGKHFAAIGEKFGSFDLALLDNGQYNPAWQAIHMLPEEGLKAAQDLNTKRLFPVHSAKFKLAHHAWDAPLKTITQLNAANHQLPLVTPQIGEVVYLRDSTQVFSNWWEGID